MIRIESRLQHPLNVPLPAAPGSKPKMLKIPAAKADGGPSVVTFESIDSITLQRLRYHYDWRPTDMKEHAAIANQPVETARAGGLRPEQIIDIGLLRISVVDAPAPEEKSSKGERTTKAA